MCRFAWRIPTVRAFDQRAANLILTAKLAARPGTEHRDPRVSAVHVTGQRRIVPQAREIDGLASGCGEHQLCARR
jgi:hypothetical protein